MGTTVTVVGAGNMGTALVRVLSKAGHDVTVWNRSADKAETLSDAATPEADLLTAIGASDLVVVSISDYEACGSLLFTPEVGQVAAGKLFVNMTSGTPDDGRAGEAWGQEHGVRYLDAAILAYPSYIGTEFATIFYSGDRATYEDAIPTLKALAKNAIFVSESAGAAAAVDCAILEAYYGGVLAFLHGAAICESEGVPTDEFFAYKTAFVGLIDITADAAKPMLASRNYDGTDCTLDVHVAALKHIVHLSQQGGLDDRLPSTLHHLYATAVTKGYGGKELPAAFEVFRKTEV